MELNNPKGKGLHFGSRRFAFVHSLSFAFILYRSLDNTVVRFVKIIKKIGDIHTCLPSGILNICGDFNIDQKKASALSEK